MFLFWIYKRSLLYNILFTLHFFFFTSLVTRQFLRYTTGTCVLFSMTAICIAHTLVEHFSFPFKKCFVVEKTHPTQYVSMKITQHGNWTLNDTV